MAHGYGGYAAQYGTKAINQLEGYHVKNLVLLDGVQVETNNNKENIPDTTTLQEILNTKTNITLYASSYNKSKKYDIWDASRDTISYDSENKFDETNAQLTGILLDTNTYDGWTKDNNLVQYLENLIS